jgi:Zn-finger nucleic acid-binding protein
MAEFDTLCPHCQARLRIDTELKAVIDSAPAEAPKTFENFDAAVGHLRSHDRERETKFQASLEAEKTKKEVLEKKFEELFKKASQDSSRPIRDIDLD